MATVSVRKKISKRSPKPQQLPLPSSTSPPFLNYKYISMAISALVILGVVVLLAVSSNTWLRFAADARSESIFGIEVVNEFPHDPLAFTQGLLYGGNDTLFESTGLYGQSSVRQVALRSGKVEAIKKMEKSKFGEGLTLLDERLYQVTWLEKTGFVYDRYGLSKLAEFTHQMQDGWGLATDGKVMFGTDGTSKLYQIDTKTLKVISQEIVRYKGHEVHYLNELEYINGEVWANIWLTDCIARISPRNGEVLSWILLPSLREGLIAAGNNGIDVLNGIAWDSEKKRLFVTGKLWPKLYEIKLQPLRKPIDGSVERICMPRPQ